MIFYHCLRGGQQHPVWNAVSGPSHASEAWKDLLSALYTYANHLSALPLTHTAPRVEWGWLSTDLPTETTACQAV